VYQDRVHGGCKKYDLTKKLFDSPWPSGLVSRGVRRCNMTSLMRLPFCSAELLGAPIPRGLLRAKLPFRKSLFLIPPCTQSWYTQFYDPRNSESLSWTTAAGPWRGGCMPSVRSMTKGGGGHNFCLNAPGIAEPLGPKCRVATLGQSLEPPPPPPPWKGSGHNAAPIRECSVQGSRQDPARCRHPR
jgi:hypothetical protein